MPIFKGLGAKLGLGIKIRVPRRVEKKIRVPATLYTRGLVATLPTVRYGLSYWQPTRFRLDFLQQNDCQLYHSRCSKNCDVRIAEAVMEEAGVLNLIIMDQYPVLSNYVDVCCEDEELSNNCGGKDEWATMIHLTTDGVAKGPQSR